MNNYSKNIFTITGIALVGNLFSSFLNYFFHFLSGRILPVSTFGGFESLIGFFAIVSIFTGIVSPVVINQITTNSNDKLAAIVKFFQQKLFYVSIFFTTLLLLLYPLFNSLLKLDGLFVYFVLIVQIIGSIYFVFYQSVFQSQLKVVYFLAVGLSFSAIKLFFLFVFSRSVLSPYASNLSYCLSYVLIALAGAIALNRQIKNKPVLQINISSKKLISFSLISLLTNFFITFILYQDSIISRYYLTEFASGNYAAASLISKIIFFLSASILIVFYPLFSKHQNQKSIKKYFLTGLFFVSSIGLTLLIAYNLFPKTIVQILFGSKFISVYDILPQLSGYMFLYSIFYFLIQFLLSQQNLFSALISGLVMVTQLGLVMFGPKDMALIIRLLTIPLVPAIVVAGSISFYKINKNTE